MKIIKMREKFTGRNIKEIILGRLSPSKKCGNTKINSPLQVRGEASIKTRYTFSRGFRFFPQRESYVDVVRGKSDPLEAWSGPEGSRKLRFPDFMTTA
jgi:hypothetical protein